MAIFSFFLAMGYVLLLREMYTVSQNVLPQNTSIDPPISAELAFLSLITSLTKQPAFKQPAPPRAVAE